MLAGKFLSDKFGLFASFVAGLLLIALGVQMIWSSLRKSEESVMTPVGLGLIIFATSVSLDSFSLGLTLGIYGAKTAVVIICFGIVATILTWAGLLIGKKAQGWVGSYSTALGGSESVSIWNKITISFIIKALFLNFVGFMEQNLTAFIETFHGKRKVFSRWMEK